MSKKMHTLKFYIARAARLDCSTSDAAKPTAFFSLDGSVDEIVHMVDKAEGDPQFMRVSTIVRFAERLVVNGGFFTTTLNWSAWAINLAALDFDEGKTMETIRQRITIIWIQGLKWK